MVSWLVAIYQGIPSFTDCFCGIMSCTPETRRSFCCCVSSLDVWRRVDCGDDTSDYERSIAEENPLADQISIGMFAFHPTRF